ncbi:MAG TPA: DUF2510 domain-containing protein [Candidatus Angelobacter sp.]|nr:DUF2510 domain-containing protein [Candidatus Angelobacter sp.]
MVAPPTSPGWYSDPRDGTVQRWWNGISWSDDVRPAVPTAPTFDGSNAYGATDDGGSSVPGVRRPRRLPRTVYTVLLVVNVLVVIALIVPVLTRALVTRNYRLISFSGKTAVLGHVWGPSCRPVVFHVPSSIGADVYAQFSAVVDEARGHGLPVSIRHTSVFTMLTPPGFGPNTPSDTRVPAGDVYLVADAGPPPVRADGRPYHFETDPRVLSAGDADMRPFVVEEIDTIHTRSFDSESPQYWRQAMRVMVGWAWLIGRSTDATSGLSVDDATDEFTPTDVRELGYESGCDTH